jgi:hypothetical protein
MQDVYADRAFFSWCNRSHGKVAARLASTYPLERLATPTVQARPGEQSESLLL